MRGTNRLVRQRGFLCSTRLEISSDMRTRTATNRCLLRMCRTCVGVLAGLLLTSACNRDSNTGSLHDDVNMGRIKEVEARLDTGEPVDSKDDDGLTALHLAFLSKDRKIIELLLARGADITMTDPLGHSVLHLIARDTPAFCTLLALDRGIPVDARTNDGTSALHRASYSGNRAVAELLVRRGALVDARDDAGRTPLHFAAAQREIWPCCSAGAPTSMQPLEVGAPCSTTRQGGRDRTSASKPLTSLLSCSHTVSM